MSTTASPRHAPDGTLGGRYRLDELSATRPECRRFRGTPIRAKGRYSELGTGFGGGDAAGESDEVLIEVYSVDNLEARAALIQRMNGYVALPAAQLQRGLEAGEWPADDKSPGAYIILEPIAAIWSNNSVTDGVDAAMVIQTTATGLAVLHSRGFVHGEITAADVVRCRGSWKLSCPDFASQQRNDEPAAADRRADDVYQLAATFWPKTGTHGATKEFNASPPAGIERALHADRRFRCTAAELALGGRPLPSPPGDLTIEECDGRFEACFTTPTEGLMQLYVADRRPDVKTGDVRLVEDLRSLGTATAAEKGRARLPSLSDKSIFVTPVVVSGKVGVVGTTVCVSGISNVEQVSVRVDRRDRMLVRWRWPQDVDGARVTVRRGRFAEGPDGSDYIDFSRLQYDEKGTAELPLPNSDLAYVTVFALKRRADGLAFASGTTRSSRVRLEIDRLRTVVYRVEPIRRWRGFRLLKSLQLVLTTSRATDLPELVFVARTGYEPLGPHQGYTLCRVAPGVVCSPGKRVVLPLEGVRFDRPWSGRLFPTDENECAWLRLEAANPGKQYAAGKLTDITRATGGRP